MTSSGNETFLKEKYKIGSSIFYDYDKALIYYLQEKNRTSAGGDIETIKYWDFG